MKIVLPGKAKRTERAECSGCGCVFDYTAKDKKRHRVELWSPRGPTGKYRSDYSVECPHCSEKQEAF